MKRIVVNVSERLIRRALARVFLESLRADVAKFLSGVATAVAVLVAASSAGLITANTAWAVVVGLLAALLIGAVILANSYWQNSKQAIEVYRKAGLKTVEVALQHEGCTVRFGDWAKVLPWANFRRTADYGDFMLLKFDAEPRKLGDQEIRALAKNLSLREGGDESLGFPILSILPLPRYQFVIIPTDAGIDGADLKTYLPSS